MAAVVLNRFSEGCGISVSLLQLQKKTEDRGVFYRKDCGMES